VANGRLLERVIAEGAQDPRRSLELGPAGRGYVSFLLEVSFRRSPLELAVALLPCPWSYAEIGRSLADAGVERPIYRDWVDYLRSDEALALSDTMVGDLDAASMRPPQRALSRSPRPSTLPSATSSPSGTRRTASPSGPTSPPPT